ncbi:MAG: MFS transporter [Candidatus Brocadiia bacterium]
MVRFGAHYFLLFAVMATVYPYFQLLLRARGFAESEVGYLLGLLALAEVAGPMALGWAADRLGAHRRMLAACLVAFALLVVPLGLTSAFWAAALLVLGIGFTARVPIPLADTLASAHLPDPAHDYGRVRLWGSIGFITTLFGIRIFRLVDETSSWSMISAMIVAVAVCLVSVFFLPGGASPENTDGKGQGDGDGFDAVFWIFILVAALHMLGMTSYYSFVTMYLHDKVGMESGAWVWAVGSACEIPILFLGGRIIRRYGLRAMLMAAMGAAAVRLTVFAAAPYLWAVLPAQALHAATFGLFHAASIEFIRRKVPAARRGAAMAIYMSIAIALTRLIGSAAGGVIIENRGYSTLYLTYALFPLAGLLIMAAAGSRRFALPAG